MPNHSHRLNELFQLYLSNTITSLQYSELLHLLNIDDQREILETELHELWLQSAKNTIALTDNVWNEKLQFLLQQVNENERYSAPIRTMPFWKKYGWVAALLILAFTSGIVYYISTSNSSLSNNADIANADTVKGVLPGGNKAILTLADGTSVVLDSSSDGTIAEQGSAKIIKLNNGQLQYNSSTNDEIEVLFNTLTTPRGGQYQVTLVDGTIVWLNAGSSLRYPTVFTGEERRVEVTGEVYFEVAKDAKHPFKVKINSTTAESEEVQVLGTQFNINAYNDEPMVHTTLVEGNIKINGSVQQIQMKPGQQWQNGLNMQGKLINSVDVEEVIAWKNGKFQFDNAEIRHVMRQLARWYDIEVEYNGDVSRHFNGTLSRNVNLLKVLQMLELTGEVNFKVNGRRITVMP